jgi:hypothetical protein
MKSILLSSTPLVIMALMAAANDQTVTTTTSLPLTLNFDPTFSVLPAPTVQTESAPIKPEDLRSLYILPYTPSNREADFSAVNAPEVTTAPFSESTPPWRHPHNRGHGPVIASGSTSVASLPVEDRPFTLQHGPIIMSTRVPLPSTRREYIETDVQTTAATLATIVKESSTTRTVRSYVYSSSC